MSTGDLSQFSLQDLFRLEAETQTQALTAGLLELERNPSAADRLESCMRAAHSLKGAARIIDLTPGVNLAHAMEDCFVAAQRGQIRLRPQEIGLLLRGVDLLTSIANPPEPGSARTADTMNQTVDGFLDELRNILDAATNEPAPAVAPTPSARAAEPVPAATGAPQGDSGGRVLRVTADKLNSMLGLAAESRVESRRLKPLTDSLTKLKRLHAEANRVIETLRECLSQPASGEQVMSAVAEIQHRVLECQNFLAGKLAELDAFDSRSTKLAHRLYDVALACSMRPFADGARGFPRMVRDLGCAMGKELRLEITGAETQVDRDILEKLDAPLGHLLRNAVDHGIELPEERLAVGKPAEGLITLEARHSSGMLQILVSDDGRGVDIARVRASLIERKLTTAEIADRMSEAELLDFLFLPGFTMKETVTEISGRGVGLDVVQDMIKQVRGLVRVSSEPGRGTRFQLQLPLTLSVLRTLLAEVGGETYAFPLAAIIRTLKVPKADVELLEGRQHVEFEGRRIGIVNAHQILGTPDAKASEAALPIIVVGHQHGVYGFVVDRFLGERELVVQRLDPRLGRVKDISAAALMEDGLPALIVDIDDLIRSVERLNSAGHLQKAEQDVASPADQRRKRVLVVDDSLTVRELERKLLSQRGYETDIAVDGMDGWNAVRTGDFDLVVTDIDMPRMDGIELVTLIKKDPRLKSLPVMIVSYKDREEDRRRGLDAGADYYLTKGSFHDETLLQAVIDLIGEPVP